MSQLAHRPAWLRYGGLGLALPLALLAGCGQEYGKVSGRVLFDGKPLPGGRVTFRPADPRANSVSAELDAQGNYQAVLPVGAVQVSVDNRELEPPAKWGGGPILPPGLSPEAKKALGEARGNPPEKAPPANAAAPDADRPRGRYVPIPERYFEIETADLRFQVTGGEQRQDITLTK